MSDGLKRNMQYLSRYQFRVMTYYVEFGILYGIAMAFFLSESKAESWQNGLGFFRLFLVIAVTSTQISVVKSQLPFVLSLSSRRSDLIRGHFIMTVEMVLEASLLLAIGNLIGAPHQSVADLGAVFLKYVVLLLITSSMGVLIGLLPAGMGAVVARIVMIVVFAIAISIVTAISAAISREEAVMSLLSGLAGQNTDTFVVVIGVVCAVTACVLTILAHGMVARKVRKMEVQF